MKSRAGGRPGSRCAQSRAPELDGKAPFASASSVLARRKSALGQTEKDRNRRRHGRSTSNSGSATDRPTQPVSANNRTSPARWQALAWPRFDNAQNEVFGQTGV